jgi:hypothetical protein
MPGLPENISMFILKLFQLLIKLKKGNVNLYPGKDKKQGGAGKTEAVKQDCSLVLMEAKQ